MNPVSARLLNQQLIAPQFSSPHDVVEWLGAVQAQSTSDSAYAGGIAARNNPNCIVTACRQTGDVLAEAPKKSDEEEISAVYDFTGGIVGYNAGIVEESFYTGAVAPYDETSFVGGVCGLTYATASLNLLQNQLVLSVSIRDCAYLAGNAENYAFGSIILNSQWNFNSIQPGYIYGAAQLAESDDIRILKLRTTAASTMEELKALEIYFE